MMRQQTIVSERMVEGDYVERFSQCEKLVKDRRPGPMASQDKYGVVIYRRHFRKKGFVGRTLTSIFPVLSIDRIHHTNITRFIFNMLNGTHRIEGLASPAVSTTILLPVFNVTVVAMSLARPLVAAGDISVPFATKKGYQKSAKGSVMKSIG
ncbi:MAG: hypothetical protein ACYTBP_17010 [Planctomycetota bacterium]